MAKILFLDLETTGFSREWDYIIEVAAILYDEETGEELDTFHEYIKPGKKISMQISQITGIDDYKVRNCRDEGSVLSDFFAWIHVSKPTKIVGHNYKSFDGTFLSSKAIRYNLKMLTDFEVVDTLQIARKLTKEGKLPVVNHKQTTLAQFYEIDYRAHSAIEDVRALIKIFEKLGGLKPKTKRDELGF